jgi:hypothetical protein
MDIICRPWPRRVRNLLHSRWSRVGRLAGVALLCASAALTLTPASSLATRIGIVEPRSPDNVDKLVVTLTPARVTTVVGKPVVLNASIHGPALLNSVAMLYGDGTPATAAIGHPSCAAGTSMHVQMEVTYRHTYRRAGTYRAVLTVDTTKHAPPCAVTTTVKKAIIVVRPTASVVS